MPIVLRFCKTGGHILLCTRGAGGFPAQGGQLRALHPQEEGKPAREPSWPGKGAAGGGPGAHYQEGGDERTLTQHLHELFWHKNPYYNTLPLPSLRSSTTSPSSTTTSSTSTTTSSTLKTSRRRSPSRARRTST